MGDLPHACARIGCAERGVPTHEHKCSACGHATHPVGALLHRGAKAGRVTVLVSDLEIEGGHGHTLAAGRRCDLAMSSSAVLLQSPEEQVWAEIGLEDVTFFEVADPLRDDVDAGLMGAALDVGGITSGLAYEALTVFSEPKTVTAVVRLGTRGCEYALTHPYERPPRLRAAVAPLTIALRDLRHDRERRRRPSSGGDLAGQLATLARLHTEGSLTDDEFAAAKDKLLR